MTYNNGISTTAKSIVIDEEKSDDDFVVIKEIVDWQIVNGGQTTASIHNALQTGVDISQVNVQIKLTVIREQSKTEEMVGFISKYANSQNKINMSDFSANDPYHIEMARLSEKIYVPSEMVSRPSDGIMKEQGDNIWWMLIVSQLLQQRRSSKK